MLDQPPSMLSCWCLCEPRNPGVERSICRDTTTYTHLPPMVVIKRFKRMSAAAAGDRGPMGKGRPALDPDVNQAVQMVS